MGPGDTNNPAAVDHTLLVKFQGVFFSKNIAYQDNLCYNAFFVGLLLVFTHLSYHMARLNFCKGETNTVQVV